MSVAPTNDTSVAVMGTEDNVSPRIYIGFGLTRIMQYNTRHIP